MRLSDFRQAISIVGHNKKVNDIVKGLGFSLEGKANTKDAYVTTWSLDGTFNLQAVLDALKEGYGDEDLSSIKDSLGGSLIRGPGFAVKKTKNSLTSSWELIVTVWRTPEGEQAVYL